MSRKKKITSKPKTKIKNKKQKKAKEKKKEINRLDKSMCISTWTFSSFTY